MSSILNSTLAAVISTGVLSMGASWLTMQNEMAKFQTQSNSLERRLTRLEETVARESDIARAERQRIMDILLERL